MNRNVFADLHSQACLIKHKRALYAGVLLLSLLTHTMALAREGGQIIREARCKLVIRGPLNVSVGDVLTVTRRPRGMGAVVGTVRISQATPGGDFTATAVGSRGNCRKFLFSYVKQIAKVSQPRALPPVRKPIAPSQVQPPLGTPSFENQAIPPSVLEPKEQASLQKVAVIRPPEKMSLALGFGGANTNLRGVSRVTALEDYPLVLGSLSVQGVIYPFVFVSGSKPLVQGIGIEGAYRLTSSIGDVQVVTPSTVAGFENKLGISVKRDELRVGASMRVPILEPRLHGQFRLGYYRSSIASVLNKFEPPAGSSEGPLELSPLRDLKLSGAYTFGGIIFKPISSFRTQLNFGTLLFSNYTVDNRIQDASKSSPAIESTVSEPSVFFFDASLGYMLLKYLQVGIDFSMNTSRGKALFPDGNSRAPITELYFFYGLSAALVL